MRISDWSSDVCSSDLPTMARHPVTPMHEADLRRHLAAQTDMPIALVPIDRIQAGTAPTLFDAVSDGAVLFDGIDMPSLAAAGDLMQARGRHSAEIGRAHV